MVIKLCLIYSCVSAWCSLLLKICEAVVLTASSKKWLKYIYSGPLQLLDLTMVTMNNIFKRLNVTNKLFIFCVGQFLAEYTF